MRITRLSIVISALMILFGCLPIIAQEKDSLALPWEEHLNERQPPDTVLKAIGILPGMVIGEVGAGRGRYTVQIAARIGSEGRLYANDINSSALEYLETRCKKHGFSHVKTLLGAVTETKLPEGALDMVIMVNVVHCLDKPVELLQDVQKSLKPGGSMVIVEGNLDKYPDAGAWYPREKLLDICRDAGYVLHREETFLPKDNIYILKVDQGQEADSTKTSSG